MPVVQAGLDHLHPLNEYLRGNPDPGRVHVCFRHLFQKTGPDVRDHVGKIFLVAVDGLPTLLHASDQLVRIVTPRKDALSPVGPGVFLCRFHDRGFFLFQVPTHVSNDFLPVFLDEVQRVRIPGVGRLLGTLEVNTTERRAMSVQKEAPLTVTAQVRRLGRMAKP